MGQIYEKMRMLCTKNKGVGYKFIFFFISLVIKYVFTIMSLQICGFLAGLFHSNLTKRVLVVAPKTLLPHWIKELGVVGLAGKTRE